MLRGKGTANSLSPVRLFANLLLRLCTAWLDSALCSRSGMSAPKEPMNPSEALAMSALSRRMPCPISSKIRVTRGLARQRPPTRGWPERVSCSPCDECLYAFTKKFSRHGVNNVRCSFGQLRIDIARLRCPRTP